MVDGFFVPESRFEVDIISISDGADVDEDIGQFFGDGAEVRGGVDLQAFRLAYGLEQLADLFAQQQALVSGGLILEPTLCFQLRDIGLEFGQGRIVLELWHGPSSPDIILEKALEEQAIQIRISGEFTPSVL